MIKISPRLDRACIVIALCALVGGCAAPFPKANIASARDAQAAVVVGKSTKSEVAAALGPAIVATFDSGYEVWVYREESAVRRFMGLFGQPTREKAELVILFEPSGVVAKSRVRVPPPNIKS
jgi:outer membrane protein assembly factor BamE (lipoprotein component of BamABCDE complex)